jgi:ATP-binding cassette subfamily F protein 3
VQGEEASVQFSFPVVDPRQGCALRTEQLVIGYPEHEVANRIQLEIDHGTRVGIVGDNGQGKTTFLRTICDSIAPIGGKLKWGYGCQVGVYAQHVYTSLPEKQTVNDYLHYQAAPGTTIQQVKDVAGSLLFSGQLVEKRIKVLSGGERARLVLAGLLLQKHNVLILDEPGNHLDVESVEALADALCRYQGTVLFTSHDRHFMHRVATAVVEVRDGRVISYPASYDDYVYRIRQELEAGLRAEHTTRGTPPTESGGRQKIGGREERELQKKLKSVERKIAKLDEEKKTINKQLLTATAAKDAQDLHQQLTTHSTEVEQLEEEWLEVYNELEDA